MTLVDLDRINLREICPNPYPWENDDSAYEDLKDFLYSQPVVDAKPIIHAHWIDTGFYESGCYNSEKIFCCSNCSHEDIDIYNKNYCPNCGSEMDEKSE